MIFLLMVFKKYYTLSGVKVEKPVAGVYVKRQGGKSVKVVVK